MSITNVNHKTILATYVEVAQTPSARMQGLLGRAGLPLGHALVITHCQSIHMFFMKFPLDIVFIDQSFKVVGICVNIQPFHLSPIFFSAHQAIELPAGTITSTQTKLGDFLQFS